MSACDRFVYLQAGLVVPVEAFNLALSCESRGIKLLARGDVLDVEGPLTPEILESLRRWKYHVIDILKYTADDRHLFDPAIPFPQHGPVSKGSNAA